MEALKKNLVAAATHYTEEQQALQTVEEMAELAKEIMKKYNRGSSNMKELIGEMADVYNMLDQLRIIYKIPRDGFEKLRLIKSEKCLKDIKK